MKQQATLTLHMPEELLRQLLFLCEAERRTPNNQFLFMLRNSIAYYERTKGRMPKEKLNAYDVAPYFSTEDGRNS